MIRVRGDSGGSAGSWVSESRTANVLVGRSGGGDSLGTRVDEGSAGRGSCEACVSGSGHGGSLFTRDVDRGGGGGGGGASGRNGDGGGNGGSNGGRCVGVRGGCSGSHGG